MIHFVSEDDDKLDKASHYLCHSIDIPQELKGIDLERFWNPLLFIENVLSETKEATWLTAIPNAKDEVFIFERRRVRGVFMENLELNDFPLDVQVGCHYLHQ